MASRLADNISLIYQESNMLFIIIIIIMYAGLLFLLKGDKDTQIKK